jgi:Leucine-rich repeat (LRR) protein
MNTTEHQVYNFQNRNISKFPELPSMDKEYDMISLRGNLFTKVPPEVSGIRKIEKLDLSRNLISSLNLDDM